MENMDKGLKSTKCSENTPNTPKIDLPKPKSLGFRQKKALLGIRSPWCKPSDFSQIAYNWLTGLLVRETFTVHSISAQIMTSQ